MSFLIVHNSLAVPHEFATEAATLLVNTVEEATGHNPALRVNRPAPELAETSISI